MKQIEENWELWAKQGHKQHPFHIQPQVYEIKEICDKCKEIVIVFSHDEPPYLCDKYK